MCTSKFMFLIPVKQEIKKNTLLVKMGRLSESVEKSVSPILRSVIYENLSEFLNTYKKTVLYFSSVETIK